jgi:peptidoglycan/xylan/chitin deacetylase (PgdA/CDA1 family)
MRCFDAAALAGRPEEAKPRHPGPADAFVPPPPADAADPIRGDRAGVVRRFNLPAGDRRIALTFDLCQTRSPIAGYDGAIVDYLRANAVPATFFPAGRWLATHAERALQLIADPLFAVGNHSLDHPDLHFADAARIRSETLVTEAILADFRRRAAVACTGADRADRPRLFRFPYGSCSADGIAEVNGIGSVIVQWDVVSGDPDGTSAALIERNVLAGVRPGSIVVMHANGRGTHTAEALRTIVPKLRAAGYAFATVPDLLKSGRPVAASACFINRIGDTARYDSPKKREHPTHG